MTRTGTEPEPRQLASASAVGDGRALVPRAARVVAVGVPHHITQRGNNQQDVFLLDEDRRQYLKALAEDSTRYGMRLLAWRLMTNHVHLVAVAARDDAFARALQRCHSRWAQRFNRQPVARISGLRSAAFPTTAPWGPTVVARSRSPSAPPAPRSSGHSTTAIAQPRTRAACGFGRESLPGRGMRGRCTAAGLAASSSSRKRIANGGPRVVAPTGVGMVVVFVGLA